MFRLITLKLFYYLFNSYFNIFPFFSFFFRKVYLILMCQLAISAAFIALFVYNDNVKVMFQNSGLIWVSFFITIACLFIMSCFDSARRTPPTNYIFLFIFTLAESFMLGVISSVYDPNVVRNIHYI